MATDPYRVLEQIDLVRQELARRSVLERPNDDAAAQALNEELAALEEQLASFQRRSGPSPDEAFVNLSGITGEPLGLEQTLVDPAVRSFDETVVADRLYAVADLYFIYMHERLGVFDVVLELQRQFRAGRVNLSTGTGAQRLYRYDRRRVLQYTAADRKQAYRRVFGYYPNVKPPAGAEPFDGFHKMFAGFNKRVAAFSRDRRVSEVIKPGASGASGYGSVAMVRRSGLDLRSRLKKASYGHVNVLTREVSTLLRSAFDVLEAPDIRNLYGASDAWDVIDVVARQHLRREPWSSQRNRMAVTGREVLRWLAGSSILTQSRPQFEILLRQIEEPCEEWITSEAAVRAGRTSRRSGGRSGGSNVVALKRAAG